MSGKAMMFCVVRALNSEFLVCWTLRGEDKCSGPLICLSVCLVGVSKPQLFAHSTLPQLK